ncbi:NADH-quinone oxidoreductase subunit I [bacterium]|nr:MAG: NADH-quinone oxidoreductase subunit I [bacterium]
MVKYFTELFSGMKSLLVGMGITARVGMRKPITVHYPFETLNVTKNFRSHIELALDPEKGFHKCITCGMCERACPSGCITIKSEKPEGAKKKELVAYYLDYTKCSLCANCVESCPTDAIEFSNDYKLVGTSRHDFHFELLGRAKKRLEKMGKAWTPPEAEPPKTEAPKPKAEATAPTQA